MTDHFNNLENWNVKDRNEWGSAVQGLTPLINSKFQAPNSKQAQNSKFEIQNYLEFELLFFEFVWNLVFGIWNL